MGGLRRRRAERQRELEPQERDVDVGSRVVAMIRGDVRLPPRYIAGPVRMGMPVRMPVAMTMGMRTAVGVRVGMTVRVRMAVRTIGGGFVVAVTVPVRRGAAAVSVDQSRRTERGGSHDRGQDDQQSAAVEFSEGCSHAVRRRVKGDL